MSAYEAQRLRNIARNTARLEELGLIQQPKKCKAPSKAKRRQPSSVALPPRLSRRLRGLQPDGLKEKGIVKHRLRLSRTIKVDRPIHNKTTTPAPNRTATHEHCLMRIHSMSHAQLANRIRAIERARGKHCVEKLFVFVECLDQESLHELARQAKDALERVRQTAG